MPLLKQVTPEHLHIQCVWRAANTLSRTRMKEQWMSRFGTDMSKTSRSGSRILPTMRSNRATKISTIVQKIRKMTWTVCITTCYCNVSKQLQVKVIKKSFAVFVKMEVQNTPLFLKNGEGFREENNLFSREKKFFPSPIKQGNECRFPGWSHWKPSFYWSVLRGCSDQKRNQRRQNHRRFVLQFIELIFT